MSFLDPKPLTQAAAVAQAGNPATPLGAALSATFVRFLDTDGNPISGSLVTIVVDTVLNEISDITVEEI